MRSVRVGIVFRKEVVCRESKKVGGKLGWGLGNSKHWSRFENQS
jgi:hypothetical protein